MLNFLVEAFRCFGVSVFHCLSVVLPCTRFKIESPPLLFPFSLIVITTAVCSLLEGECWSSVCTRRCPPLSWFYTLIPSCYAFWRVPTTRVRMRWRADGRYSGWSEWVIGSFISWSEWMAGSYVLCVIYKSESPLAPLTSNIVSHLSTEQV